MGTHFKNKWGDGPRGTPTVDGSHVYALAAKGELVCAKVADGNIVWKKELIGDFGGKVPGWGYCESVLVDGDNVICTPGGRRVSWSLLIKKMVKQFGVQKLFLTELSIPLSFQ